MPKLSPETVLRYDGTRRSQATVHRHYLEWRASQAPPLPFRCDNQECTFHNRALIWNNEPISLILDHINGVHGDNRPKNLRLLCPNCNSQLPTHAGGNKGRVGQSSGGFSIKGKDGKRHYTLPVENAHFATSTGSAEKA